MHVTLAAYHVVMEVTMVTSQGPLLNAHCQLRTAWMQDTLVEYTRPDYGSSKLEEIKEGERGPVDGRD